MLKVYMKRSLMLLGAAAVVATANAGAYRDVTAEYVVNHNYAGGWQGAIAQISDGVGEVWDGAFNLYQTLPDMPAGEYTLTVNAFYRCGNKEFAKANMANGALHNAYIYINGETKPVMGLFEEGENAPDGMSEAAAAFAKGKFLNTVSVSHPGGDMVVGIKNTGCYRDEWCCFDNFKLTKGGEDLSSNIVNNDFSIGMDANPMNGWECTNAGGGKKYPDTNRHGGVYRKYNASVYNYGQQIELPAGKYRWGVLSFHRYGGEGAENGKYIQAKDHALNWANGKSPKDHYDANDYETDQTYAPAYLYVGFGETKLKTLASEENFGDYNPERGDVRVRIKDCWEICNGDVAAMPHNAPYVNEGDPYETVNGIFFEQDGSERQSAAAFVNEPEKYRHWAEFELNVPTKVWVGMGKDENNGDHYWHAWADQRLEKYDDNYGAVEGVGVDVLETEGPAEYYNMQGVRVAEPTTGLYIVKQGNKVSKQLIRK